MSPLTTSTYLFTVCVSPAGCQVCSASHRATREASFYAAMVICPRVSRTDSFISKFISYNSSTIAINPTFIGPCECREQQLEHIYTALLVTHCLQFSPAPTIYTSVVDRPSHCRPVVEFTQEWLFAQSQRVVSTSISVSYTRSALDHVSQMTQQKLWQPNCY